MIRNVVWAVSNLCRGKNPSPDFEKVSVALPVLAKMLFQEDPEVLSDSCWAISYLSDGPNTRIEAVIQAGVCRRLVELLMHNQQQVVSASLRAVGNIVTGDDNQTQVVISCGGNVRQHPKFGPHYTMSAKQHSAPSSATLGSGQATFGFSVGVGRQHKPVFKKVHPVESIARSFSRHAFIINAFTN